MKNENQIKKGIMVKQKQERELLMRMVGILTKLSRHGRNQNLKIRMDGHKMQESNCSQSIRKMGHVLMQWFSNITYAGIIGRLQPRPNQSQSLGEITISLRSGVSVFKPPRRCQHADKFQKQCLNRGLFNCFNSY